MLYVTGQLLRIVWIGFTCFNIIYCSIYNNMEYNTWKEVKIGHKDGFSFSFSHFVTIYLLKYLNMRRDYTNVIINISNPTYASK